MITSFSNPLIKSIRKLSLHKERQKSGQFLVDGLKGVAEALQVDAKVDTLIIAPDLLISGFGQGVVELSQKKSIPITEVSAEVFATISQKDGPQGIAAIVQQNWINLAQINPSKNEIWIALESIQNPGNLGTIMRTGEAIGAKGIILLDQSTDPYDPTAVKASMGALFSLKLIKAEFDDFKTWVQAKKVPVIGSSDKAEQDYMTYPYPDPCILIMGSERQGLSPCYQYLCEQIVRIPMQGRSDSLNLAMATGLILYQIFNQRRGIDLTASRGNR